MTLHESVTLSPSHFIHTKLFSLLSEIGEIGMRCGEGKISSETNEEGNVLKTEGNSAFATYRKKKGTK